MDLAFGREKRGDQADDSRETSVCRDGSGGGDGRGGGGQRGWAWCFPEEDGDAVEMAEGRGRVGGRRTQGRKEPVASRSRTSLFGNNEPVRSN